MKIGPDHGATFERVGFAIYDDRASTARTFLTSGTSSASHFVLALNETAGELARSHMLEDATAAGGSREAVAAAPPPRAWTVLVHSSDELR